MDMFESFAVDVVKLQDGVWHIIESPTYDFPCAESEIGARHAILIAGMDAPKYKQAINKKMKPLIMRRGMDVDPIEQERIIGECIAEHVILDWRNWTYQGQPWSYSKGEVVKIWTEPVWVRLKQRLLAIIGDEEVFKAAHEAAIVKN